MRRLVLFILGVLSILNSHNAWAVLEVVRQTGCDLLLEGDPLPAMGARLVLMPEETEADEPVVATVTAAKGKLVSATATANSRTGTCPTLTGVSVDPTESARMQAVLAKVAGPAPQFLSPGREVWAPGLLTGWAWWSDASHVSGAEATYSGWTAAAQVDVPFWRHRSSKRVQLIWRLGAQLARLSYKGIQHVDRSTTDYEFAESAALADAYVGLEGQFFRCVISRVRCGIGFDYGLAIQSEVLRKKTWDEDVVEDNQKGGVASAHRLAVGFSVDMPLWRATQAGIFARYHLIWLRPDADPRNPLGSSLSGPQLGAFLQQLL